MTLIYPAARYRPISSHGAPMTRQDGLIEHITTNDFDPFGFFANTSNEASSTWWISGAGLVEQYFSADLRPWTQAAGNPTWCSVELSGRTGTLKTPAQVEALAHLLAWGSLHPALRWKLTPTDSPSIPGFGWHGMGGAAWGGHPDCPGRQRIAQRGTVLARANVLAHPKPAPPPSRYTIVSGDSLGGIASRHRTTPEALYGLNGPTLDRVARANGQRDSRHGALIYPGTGIALR